MTPDHRDNRWLRVAAEPLPFDRPVLPGAPAARAVLFAADIVGFSTAFPGGPDQLQARARMYGHLEAAFTMTGLPWWESHREDRGDGVLVVAPPGTPADLFLDPLAHHLRALIRNTNAHDGGPPLRMRTAVHHGDVHYDAHGVAGSDLILLFRLLNCAAFKRELRRTHTPLGMIVSDKLHRQSVEHSRLVNIAAYRPVTVTAKEIRRVPAWIWGTVVEAPAGGG